MGTETPNQQDQPQKQPAAAENTREVAKRRLRHVSYSELYDDIEGIMRDYKVTEMELVPLGVAYWREKAAEVKKRLEMIREQLRTVQEQNASKVPELQREIDRLLDIWGDIHERIADEKAILQTVEMYRRYREEYRTLKGEMKEHGLDTVVGEPKPDSDPDRDREQRARSQEERERRMDEQTDRIVALVRERTALANVISLADRVFPDPRKPNPQRDSDPKARSALDAALEHYYATTRKQPVPQLGRLTKEQIQAWWDSLVLERQDVVNRLYAEFHHSNPLLAHAEALYRRFATTKPESAERAATVRELSDLLREMQEKHFDGDPEVQRVASDIDTLLANKQQKASGRAGEDIVQLWSNLPKSKPEGILLTADLLCKQADNLMQSKEVHAEDRRALALRMNAVLTDLLRTQQSYIREFSGWEDIATSYGSDAPSETLLPDKTPGLLEYHRAECRMRIQETLRFLEDVETHSLRPTFEERLAGATSRYVIEPARRLMDHIDRLVGGERTQKTERPPSVPEILKGFDRETIEHTRQDLKIMDFLIGQPAALTRKVLEARNAMSDEEVERLEEEAESGRRLDPEEVRQLLASSDPRDHIRMWVMLDAQMDRDVGALAGTQFETIKRIEQAGTAEKTRTTEIEDFGEKMRALMRQELLRLLKEAWDMVKYPLLIAAGSYGAYHAARWWWRGRKFRALRREIRSLRTAQTEGIKNLEQRLDTLEQEFRGPPKQKPKGPPENPPEGPPEGRPKPPPEGLEPGGLMTSRLGRLGEELTKMRYATEWERRLAQQLEQTRFMTKLRAFENLKGVRIGGRVIRYGAGVAIPAVAAYEATVTELRARASKTPDLKSEYRSQHWTTGLETIGLGSTLAVGFVPAVVLGAPVIYAANYSRKRSEIRAGWKREVEDWAHEYDSPGLRREIAERTLLQAVEAGGGSTFKPRITASEKDNESALRATEGAVRSARETAYEAYFLQNLSVVPGMSDSDQQTQVRDRVQFIKLCTEGEHNKVANRQLEHADLYGELLQRYRAMQASGHEPLLSYEEDGKPRVLDLRRLVPGVGTPEEIRRLVAEYAISIRPMEELLMFNALGTAAEEAHPEGRIEAEKWVLASVRHMVIERLMHNLHDAERRIREVDWPGIDLPLGAAEGQTRATNIIRTYLADRLNELIEPLGSRLLQGEVSLEEYTTTLEKCRTVLSAVVNEQNTDHYYKAVERELGGKGRFDAAKAVRVQHLVQLLLPPQE